MKDQFMKRALELSSVITDLTIAISREKTVNYNVKDYSKGPDGMESPGEEYTVVNHLVPLLNDWGVPYQIHAKEDKRPNLLCSVGKKTPGYRKLIVLLHMDTVPSGGREIWDFDPFDAHEKNGKLYGRGVLDNKGPLASSFAVIKILKEIESQIEGEFIFGAVCDEEVQMYNVGLDWLLEKNLIDCTDAIIPDIAGEMKQIDIAEKGRVGLKIRILGKQAHAMNPEKGINAIEAACELASLIENHPFAYTPHPLLGSWTKNLGMIKGGSAPNNVPAECELTYDFRIVPGMNSKKIGEEIRALIAKMRHDKVKIELEFDKDVAPTEVRADAQIVKLIQKYCPDAKPFGMGGGTFCKHLILRGIEAVGFAPGHEETYHMANEEIEVRQLVDFAGVLSAIAFDLCNQKK